MPHTQNCSADNEKCAQNPKTPKPHNLVAEIQLMVESTKQKTLVFGATGGTGLECVKQLLEKGYPVTAFVRTPEKLGDL